MDKQSYKDLLADSYAQESELKNILKTIKTMVHDEPNNMQLGKKIRSYFLLYFLKNLLIKKPHGDYLHQKNHHFLNDLAIYFSNFHY